MDTGAVMDWVARYERAWRAGDLDGLESIFSPDVVYRVSPYAEPLVGWDAVKTFWLADEGEPFTFAAEPVAVEGDRAVVRVLVRYGQPVQQEYTDLWLIRFAADGRAGEFEEWAYWPGKAYTADPGAAGPAPG